MFRKHNWDLQVFQFKNVKGRRRTYFFLKKSRPEEFTVTIFVFHCYQ